MSACDEALAALDEVLSGASAGDDLDAHLAGCGACRSVIDARLRQHRLLLELGAEATMPFRRAALLGRLRSDARHPRRPRLRRKLTWLAALPLAAAAAVAFAWFQFGLSRPDPGPALPQPVAIVAGGLVHPWPWVDLRATPGSDVLASVAGEQHRLDLRQGRLTVDSRALANGKHLSIILGEVEAALVGTKVDVHRQATQSVIRVLAGRVILRRAGQDDVVVASGHEAHVIGASVLPPLAILAGAAWTIDQPAPGVPALPILVTAAQLERITSDIEVVEDAHVLGGVVMTSRIGSDESLVPDDAHIRPQARVQLDLHAAPAWGMHVLAAHAPNGAFGCLVWPAHGAAATAAPQKMAAPSGVGTFVWMPPVPDPPVRLEPQAGAACELVVQFYRPGGRLAAILLQPMAR